jgi:hypothetical protein
VRGRGQNARPRSAAARAARRLPSLPSAHPARPRPPPVSYRTVTPCSGRPARLRPLPFRHLAPRRAPARLAPRREARLRWAMRNGPTAGLLRSSPPAFAPARPSALRWFPPWPSSFSRPRHNPEYGVQGSVLLAVSTIATNWLLRAFGGEQEAAAPGSEPCGHECRTASPRHRPPSSGYCLAGRGRHPPRALGGLDGPALPNLRSTSAAGP